MGLIKWKSRRKTKVYLGKSYRGSIIARRKPKGSIKVASLSHYNRYVKGTKEYLIPRKNVRLIQE